MFNKFQLLIYCIEYRELWLIEIDQRAYHHERGFMNHRLLCTALLCLPALTCQAETKIAEHTLANGLKILVKEDHRSPIAVTQVWYKVAPVMSPAALPVSRTCWNT